MDVDAVSLEPLLTQWRDLPSGDRKGILRRLPVEQRLAFRRILASIEREEVETTVRAQRFRGYSPWLAELLEGCEDNAPSAAALKPAVRAALLSGHQTVVESGTKTEDPPSLASIVQSYLKIAWRRL